MASSKAVNPRDGDIALIETRPELFECFELHGFGDSFNFKKNLEEAVAFFSQ